jgi:hypothetical protein
MTYLFANDIARRMSGHHLRGAEELLLRQCHPLDDGRG